MKHKLQNLCIVAAAMLFAVSAAQLLDQLLEYRAADEQYARAKAVAMVQTLPEPADGIPLAPLPASPSPEQTEKPAEDPAETPAPEQAEAPSPEPVDEPVPPPEPLKEDVRFLLNTDVAALKSINPEVLGWICIPGTVVDYPLLQTDNNDYYLEYSWDRSKNRSGAIFMEHRSSPDFSDFNTLIYGHNLLNGIMFAPLKNYEKQDFYEKHPEVYIVDETGVRRYEIFAAYTAGITWDTYRLVFTREAQRQRFLELSAENSVLKTQLSPSAEDRILTLSTCTGLGNHSYRWVVQAVCTGVFEIQSVGADSGTAGSNG